MLRFSAQLPFAEVLHMLETFSLTTFTPLLHSRFRAQATPIAAVELELIQAEDGGSTPSQERFSLLLRGPLNSFLPQAMYPFTHEALGSFDLFIAPIRQDPNGFIYQAVFNRLR